MSQMGEVLPGLFVGSIHDANDRRNLRRYGISHIISIMDPPKRLQMNKCYLCILAYDYPGENLSQYFSACNNFIHDARLNRKSVLVHCLEGVSRSVTLAVAYIMTVTNLNWQEALKVVRAERCIARPNKGFLKQLEEFQTIRLNVERYRLKYQFPSKDYEQADREWCERALDIYNLLQHSNPDLFDTLPQLKDLDEVDDDEPKSHSSSLIDAYKKFTNFKFWSDFTNIASNVTNTGETIMANVILYRPVPKKERDTYGKFVKPIDTIEGEIEDIPDGEEEAHAFSIQLME